MTLAVITQLVEALEKVSNASWEEEGLRVFFDDKVEAHVYTDLHQALSAGRAEIARLTEIEQPKQPESVYLTTRSGLSPKTRALEHTLVVRFPDGVSPRYHVGMQVLGGTVVAVDFGGNRLQVAEVLQEALESCLQFLENDAAWMNEAEPERQAARAAIATANEVPPSSAPSLRCAAGAKQPNEQDPESAFSAGKETR